MTDTASPIPFIPLQPMTATGVRNQIAAAEQAAAGPNKSGISPVDTNVLVLMDPVVEETKGGIIIPQAHADVQAQRDIEVTFIAAGANAFRDWGDVQTPAHGERVIISRHAGMETKGRYDKLTYRILSDVDVRAVLEEQA